ncbi:MAG: NAD-dependent epimerase/dehydratase family protein [Rubricoccaceae bacterium]
MVLHLRKTGHEVVTLGRRSGDVVANLAQGPPLLPGGPFDAVYHLAGKAHVVPKTSAEAQAFFDVNALGTENLLRGLHQHRQPPPPVVLASSISVYGVEAGEGLTEETPLRAVEPYGRSKIQSEETVRAWGEQHGIPTAILRLPLLIGPSAPGNLGRMVSSIRSGRYVGIGAGEARRSMVLASDVAAVLSDAARVGGTYNLSDGEHPSFTEMEVAIASRLGVSAPRHLPLGLARAAAAVGGGLDRLPGISFPLTPRTLTKMTSTLTLNDARAREALSWAPRSVLAHADLWVA